MYFFYKKKLVNIKGAFSENSKKTRLVLAQDGFNKNNFL
jgi:hypothetical protein